MIFKTSRVLFSLWLKLFFYWTLSITLSFWNWDFYPNPTHRAGVFFLPPFGRCARDDAGSIWTWAGCTAAPCLAIELTARSCLAIELTARSLLPLGISGFMFATHCLYLHPSYLFPVYRGLVRMFIFVTLVGGQCYSFNVLSDCRIK
jgi:hypothetical protein